jgi:hypothetical protein
VFRLCLERNRDAAPPLPRTLNPNISHPETAGTVYPTLGQADDPSFIVDTVADLTRDRAELVLENAFLRQQVIVLSRDKKRPPLTNQDRRLFVLLIRGVLRGEALPPWPVS